MNNTRKSVSHPAKYTDVLLPVMARMLDCSETVLDPFGGTGKIFELYKLNPNIRKIDAVEIEPEWAALDSRMTLGNALELPFEEDSFDAVCTSPSYGNKMAGKVSKDIDKGVWKRIKYADALHRDLSEENSANFVWGKKYRQFHIKAWMETRRVIRNQGTFVLNIKNHISQGEEQFVTEWHIETLRLMQFEMVEWEKIPVPSMRRGAHGSRRIPYESLIRFVLFK